MRRNVKHFGKKVLGVVSAAAMVVTSFTGIGAAAAGSNIILENKTYNGGMQYIKTIRASEYSGKSAIKLTYEYLSLDPDGTYVNDDDETKAVDYSDTFEFVAFDMDWGGWIPTSAGVEEGVTPVVGTQYTSTVTIADIEGKLDNECQGFNFATGAIGDTQVKIIKMEYVDAEQVTAGAKFTGSWEKGVGGSFTREEGNATISCNNWYIAIRNLYVAGFKNPTIAVTVDYTTNPNNHVQAEILNGEGDNAKPIINNYPFVDKTGTVTYKTQFNNDLTTLSVCYDQCVVKKICIYDDTDDNDVVVPVTGKTAAQVAANMGVAWNLGGALESTDGDGNAVETAWGTPIATKALFRAVKAQGFNTIRIPVSFLDKIGSDNKVDRTYLARVKTLVNNAYNMGMYVVIDMHNDGGHGIPTKWLDITKTGTEFEAIKTKFAAVWTDIATYFKDYDQKLLFEGYNELMNGNYASSATPTQLANVNALAQAFVTAVRSAGGQNTDRVLIVAGYNTNIDETVNGFVKPTDTVANRLILSVHYYSPDSFALDENGTTTWGTQAEIAAMNAKIEEISDFASENGMPVFIGEYGPIDKNNTAQRAKYCYELNYAAGYYGNVVTAYWDNGVTGEYGTALFDRATNQVTATGSTIISNIEEGMADGIDDQP